MFLFGWTFACAGVMSCLENLYEHFTGAADLGPMQEEYNEILVNAGRRVRVLEPGNEYTAEAIGIDREGKLMVRREDGSVCGVYAGEVSVRGVYGYV